MKLKQDHAQILDHELVPVPTLVPDLDLAQNQDPALGPPPNLAQDLVHVLNLVQDPDHVPNLVLDQDPGLNQGHVLDHILDQDQDLIPNQFQGQDHVLNRDRVQVPVPNQAHAPNQGRRGQTLALQ